MDSKLIPEADPLFLASQIVKSTVKKSPYNNAGKDNKRKTIIKVRVAPPELVTVYAALGHEEGPTIRAPH